jgi:hypothetical protein
MTSGSFIVNGGHFKFSSSGLLSDGNQFLANNEEVSNPISDELPITTATATTTIFFWCLYLHYSSAKCGCAKTAVSLVFSTAPF